MITDYQTALQYMIAASYKINDAPEETINDIIANIDVFIIKKFYDGECQNFEDASDIHEFLWELTEEVEDRLAI